MYKGKKKVVSNIKELKDRTAFRNQRKKKLFFNVMHFGNL